MSTVFDGMSVQTPRVSTLGAVRRTPFGRLVLVEARKQVDTRAGRGLLLVIVVLLVLVQGGLLLASGAERGFAGYLEGAALPLGVLLPVVGILSATSEWGHRTAMQTFALEPRRTRVAVAKAVASTVLAVAAVGLAVALAGLSHLAAVLGLGATADWSVEPWSVLGMLLITVLYTLWGLAWGLALLNAPLTIVLFFVLPQAWTLTGLLSPGLETLSPWLDVHRALEPLGTGLAPSGLQWAHLASAVAVWIVVPFAVGLRRVARREVR
jgi:ABC-2 type transport system permease protein